MKQTTITLLLLIAIGFISCKKHTVYPDIKQYDQTQIGTYIQAHGLNQMKRDTAGGDTTGIYYQILTPPPTTGQVLTYPNYVAFVFTVSTLDGKFTQSDTLNNNHVYDLLGHIPNHSYIAYGVELALLNDLKRAGGKIRVLVPSHLAYGTDGYGTGSTASATRILGNESLDYTITVIDNRPNDPANDQQKTYDDMVIKNYLGANSLTGYTKTADGLYYKITTPSTGTNKVTENSIVTATYTATLLDGVQFQGFTTTGGTPVTISNQVQGVKEGLALVSTGASISLIMPSGIAYGNFGLSGNVAPISCVRYEFQIVSVTP
jgi:FKBP-type peptidyl-prolyl cis-trans isomerase